MSQPNLQKTSSDWLKPAGTAVGAVLLLASLSQLANGLSGVPGEKTHQAFLLGAVLFGGAAGMFGIAWGWFDPVPAEAVMQPGVFYCIGGGLTAFIGLFILRCGMHQIGGYDHSIVVDQGWRLFKGQTAYVDYPCTVPIAFPLGVKFAFQWFGVSWRSIIEITALFSMGAFVWSLLLLARLFGRGWTTLLWALAAQIFSMMLASFWWYSPISAVGAMLYTLSAVYWLRRPDDKWAMVSYCAALLLVATMKPNVAGVQIMGVSVILFLSPGHRWKVAGISLVSFALFLLLLSINHLSLAGMLAAYRGISSRGASLVPFLIGLSPTEMNMAMAAACAVLLPAVLALSQGRTANPGLVCWIPAIAMLAALFIFFAQSPEGFFAANTPKKLVGLATLFLPLFLALFVGRDCLRSLAPWLLFFALLGALYGFTTNSEQKLIDLPPVFIAALLLAAELRSPVVSGDGPVFHMPLWWNRYFAFVCVVLGAAGLAQGLVRDRIKSIGIPLFFEYDGSKHTVADGFFKGVRCGDVFDELLREEAEVMRREASATIWFGPRMQWGYAAFNKSSPLREPVIWDPLTMFEKSKRELYFDNFLQNRHQVLILFKNDLANYNQDEVQRISRLYAVDQSFPLLTILRLKQ